MSHMTSSIIVHLAGTVVIENEKSKTQIPCYLSAGLGGHLEGGLEGPSLGGAQDGAGPLGPAGVPPSPAAGPSVAPRGGGGGGGPLRLPFLIVVITVTVTLLCIHNKEKQFVIPLCLWSTSNNLSSIIYILIYHLSVSIIYLSSIYRSIIYLSISSYHLSIIDLSVCLSLALCLCINQSIYIYIYTNSCNIYIHIDIQSL